MMVRVSWFRLNVCWLSISADFVDVIHSDSTYFGAPQPTGTADFWPNLGRSQPGCPPGGWDITKNDSKILTHGNWETLLTAQFQISARTTAASSISPNPFDLLIQKPSTAWNVRLWRRFTMEMTATAQTQFSWASTLIPPRLETFSFKPTQYRHSIEEAMESSTKSETKASIKNFSWKKPETRVETSTALHCNQISANRSLQRAKISFEEWPKKKQKHEKTNVNEITNGKKWCASGNIFHFVNAPAWFYLFFLSLHHPTMTFNSVFVRCLSSASRGWKSSRCT